MITWLLFTYRVPNTPSARRVYVWRKLKGLGALLIHDAVWVLPETPQTREKLQWLAAEIKDMEEGEATLWAAQEIFTGETVDLKQQFIEPVERDYQEILVELQKKDANLAELAKRYQQTLRLDYFQSSLGEEVRQRLTKLRGLT